MHRGVFVCCSRFCEEKIIHLSQPKACEQLNLKPVLRNLLGLINSINLTNNQDHTLEGLKGRQIVAQGVSPGFDMKNKPEPCKGGTQNVNTSVAPVGLKKFHP